MVADRAAPAGYAVVGVNTWGIRHRQATNLSMPVVPTLNNFVQRGLAVRTADREASDLRERISDFSKVSAINNDDDPNERMRNIARFISINCVMESGEEALLNVLSAAPTRVRNEVLGSFGYSAFYAMRLAIAYDIDRKLVDGRNPLAIVAPEVQRSAINTARTEIIFSTAKEDKVTTVWREENNTWWLDSMRDIVVAKKADEGAGEKRKRERQKREKGTSTFEIEAPFYTTFFLEYSFSFSNHDAAGFGFMVFPFKFIGFGSGLTISHISIERAKDAFFYPENFETEEVKAWSARPVVIGRLQLPYTGNNFNVTPFIEARAGIQAIFKFDIIDPPTGIYCSAVGGVQFGLTNFYISVAGGLERIVHTFGDYSVDASNTHSGVLIFSLGWGY